MTFSFNLIDQPWIPVLWPDGHSEELSLWDTLTRAHEVQDFCGETPLVTAALYPMLMALLHRVYGPPSVKAWENLWQQGAFPPEPLEAYLHQWYERFDLFHPTHPFYQAEDNRVKPKSIVHLVHGIGATGTVFTHANEKHAAFSPSKAARHLLASQSFYTAGLSGIEEKFTDGPFTRGVIFWLKGKTLFESLMLNFMPEAMTQFRSLPSDQPLWERDDPFRRRQTPEGLLDYWTWPNNRILLMPSEAAEGVRVSQITIGPGLRLIEGIMAPQKGYRLKAKENTYFFLYFKEDKALWREFHSFLPQGSDRFITPAVIRWLALLLDEVLPTDAVYPLMAIGMLADQAKPIFYRQEEMPLPLALLGRPTAYSEMEDAVKKAETTAEKLDYAVKKLAHHVLMRGKEGTPDKNTLKNLVDQWDVLSLYWAQIEPAFWTFVMAVSREETTAAAVWHKALRDAAQDALDKAVQMAGRGVWALRGQIEAENALRGMLKKEFGDRS